MKRNKGERADESKARKQAGKKSMKVLKATTTHVASSKEPKFQISSASLVCCYLLALALGKEKSIYNQHTNVRSIRSSFLLFSRD